MSKFIKEYSLSVGYNNTGQEFFDILHKYEKYIHSYFFSLDELMNGNCLDQNEVIKSLSCNTYNILGNLLFNDKNYDKNTMLEKINLSKNTVNLKSVTVLDGTHAKIVKNKYPDIEVHLSVRFFDFNPNVNQFNLINELIKNNFLNYIDVINISFGVFPIDKNLIDLIHQYDIKVKLILNEECIVGRAYNYKDFKGYENTDCFECIKNCSNIIVEYPWMELSREPLYKEQLQFIDGIDIYKLSTRNFPNVKSINELLDYYINNRLTDYIGYERINNYDAFLEWCEYKIKNCSYHCINCKKCEEFYDKIIKGE